MKYRVLKGRYAGQIVAIVKRNGSAGQARAYAETLGKPKALVAAASLGPKIKLVDTDVPCLPLGKVVDHLKAA